ncbi:hypothetical protein PANDA_013961 [Ailuropoda melanoleuca]|uniref:Small integral membrane protein 20 n=1 Tax=Ailuropoda melanoleuca TaxID=9646 RepID=D2HQ30_AILME|nr:hypothetical protein PANDA_013961 [Ailuropoda melanoleuca]
MSRNLRTVLIFGSFISLIGAAFYPIYFRPLMRLEEYRLWADRGEGHSSWKRRARAPWVQPDSGEEAEVFLVLGGVSASSGPLVPPSHWFALATVAVWSLLPLIQLGTGAHPVLDDPVRRQTGAVFLLCFSEKEQAINRAGIVQEDVQPPEIKELSVLLSCLDVYKRIVFVLSELSHQTVLPTLDKSRVDSQREQKSSCTSWAQREQTLEQLQGMSAPRQGPAIGMGQLDHAGCCSFHGQYMHLCT